SAGFILLKKGKSGFTLPDRWVKDKPVDGGQDYVNCKVGGIYFAGRKHQNRVYYPFDRFFMNEYKAPAAEKVLRASFTKEHKVYITLRVKDGVGIIEELWVDQQTISDYLNSINMTSEKGL
ncbi:MAG: GDYXXLXY domain-containing protein, partial [Lentisphaeria bacterium]|nr:GDYXXLXY domain-containing protein [Lentisphaeria bacterium]